MNVLACASTNIVKSQHLCWVLKILTHSIRAHSNEIKISCVIVIAQIDGLGGIFRQSQILKVTTFWTQNVQLRPTWSRQQLYRAKVSILLVYCLINCVSLETSSILTNLISEATELQSQYTRTKKEHQNFATKFRLYTEATKEDCRIFYNQLETLDKCSFNASLPLVIIVHGWSV